MTGRLILREGYWNTVINYKEGGKYKQKWEKTEFSERGNKKEAAKILEQRLALFEQEEQRKKEKIQKRIQPKKEDLDKAEWLFSKYLTEFIDNQKEIISPQYYLVQLSYLKIFKEYFDNKKFCLIDITADELKDFNDYLLTERGVTTNTVKHYACILRPALREAFKAGIIPDNPYDFMPVMGKEKPKVGYYDKKELDTLLEKLKGNPLELAYKMLIYYGLRRSELVGLRWHSIDFEHDMISINHKVIKFDTKIILSNELKTKTSFRTLPLIPEIKKDLLEHKKSIEENKKYFGNTYNQTYLDYVFVNEDGRLVYPDHLSHAFSKFLKANKLKHIRLHDLRHSCASLLLAKGVPMKQIQDWLGHSNFATTADIYSHLDFSAKKQSANVIQDAFGCDDKAVEKDEDSQKALAWAYKKMKQYGFQTLEEYFAYLESNVEIFDNYDETYGTDERKSGYEM